MLTTHEWVYRPTTQRLVLKIVAIDRYWKTPVTRLVYDRGHKFLSSFFWPAVLLLAHPIFASDDAVNLPFGGL
jgi:hypothetical protein